MYNSPIRSTEINPPPVTRLSSGERSYTSVRIAPSHSRLHKAIRNPQALSGWFVNRAGIQPWKWNGTVEHREWLYLTFADIDVELYPFTDVFRKETNIAIPMIKSLLDSLSQIAQEAEFEPDALMLTASYFDDEGNLYILHPEIAQLTQQHFEELCPTPGMDQYGPVGRKELIPMTAYLLQLNILNARTDEKQAAEAGSLVKAHLHSVVPELNPQIADFLFKTINRQSTVASSIEDIRNAADEIAAWQKTDLFEQVHLDEAEERRSSAVAVEKSLRKREKLRSFRKKHGSTLILTAAALVAIAFLVTPFIKRAAEPHVTEGLTPVEVIELFYTSHNSLNHEAMAECTTSSIGNSHINQVTTLFVIARIRQGVELKDVFTSAPEWLEAGKPALKDGSFVFGITEMDISRTEESNRFEVSYIKWTTLPPDAEELTSETEQAQVTSTGQVRASRIIERLYMAETNRGWKIDNIELIQQEPLEERSN